MGIIQEKKGNRGKKNVNVAPNVGPMAASGMGTKDMNAEIGNLPNASMPKDVPRIKSSLG